MIRFFLSESKWYSIFLHLFYNFQLILYNTNQLISNKIYKDNHLSGCVYTMINFVFDLSTLFYHQKDSKLVCFVSPHLVCLPTNEFVALVVSDINKQRV